MELRFFQRLKHRFHICGENQIRQVVDEMIGVQEWVPTLKAFLIILQIVEQRNSHALYKLTMIELERRSLGIIVIKLLISFFAFNNST